MNAWKPLLLVPLAAAVAMVPQDPAPAGNPPGEQIAIVSLAELHYIGLDGTKVSVPARNIVEIRFLESAPHAMRLELLYDNSDYSLLDVQGFHLVRSGSGSREVRLVRSKTDSMRFPRLP